MKCAGQLSIQNALIFDYLTPMKKLTHAEIGERRAKKESLASLQRLPVTVVVDSVRSLYNVGSIFRTSDGVLLEKLILTGFTPTPPRKEIEKTALGATESVPWEYVRDPGEAIRGLKRGGLKAFCLELTDTMVPYHAIRKPDFPLLLVIGNEITGVSKEALSECDLALEIPQFGIKQSLNVGHRLRHSDLRAQQNLEGTEVIVSIGQRVKILLLVRMNPQDPCPDELDENPGCTPVRDIHEISKLFDSNSFVSPKIVEEASLGIPNADAQRRRIGTF